MKRYIAKGTRLAVPVPLTDPQTGEKIVQRNPLTNEPVITANGEYAYRSRIIRFDETISQNPSTGYWIAKTTQDPEEIKVLDRLVANGQSSVMTEDDWKKMRNPVAYEQERRAKELEASLNTEKTVSTRLRDELNKAKNQLDRMRGKDHDKR